MSLYRKYRPLQFKELVGQDTIRTILQQALLKDRLSHAYLLTGPRGTGKTSTARILARAVNCLAPVIKEGSYEPCSKCEACVSLLEGSTPDLIEIDAASNRGIEDIRELREQVQYHPVQLKKKVYIIDEVHMLTTEAFNALLKTLEEPPSYCLFILATTEPHKIPLTIRSRCQLLRLERGTKESIYKKLKAVVKAEGLQIDDSALKLVAEHAEGGYRDAETLLESLTGEAETITTERLQAMLGLTTTTVTADLLAACLSGNSSEVRQILHEKVATAPHSVERFTTQLLNQLRDDLLASEKPDRLLSYALEQLLEAYILHKHAPIPSLPLEIACLNIAAVASKRQGAAAVEEKVVPDEKPAPAIAQTAIIAAAPSGISVHVPTASEEPAKVPVVELREEYLQDVRKAWKRMIEQVCSENIVLGQALKDTVFHTASSGIITIHVRFKFHADKMSEKRNAARIKTFMQDLTGQSWDIHYIVSSTLPKHQSKKELHASVDDAKAVFSK